VTTIYQHQKPNSILLKQFKPGNRISNTTSFTTMASSSQITSTNTGQYDQIFALSQGYLNKSFSTLYNASLNGGSQLHTLSVKNISGIINATIGDPEIAIDIAGDQNVIFYIPITWGTMKLRDNESG
jgi:hypothetical protein